jgi:hypothetical protein
MRDGSPPRVYLEVIACTPDTKEHETLVVTRARPSHVHAALLAAGFTPGSPGSWEWTGEVMRSKPPTGDAVVVELVYADADGREVVRPASDFVVNAETGARLAETGFRFAGSRMAVRSGREVYDADGTGTLVGLATFGAETVAWGEVFSPEASVQEPEWIADPARMPRVDTPVVVRLRAAGS